MKKLIVLLVIMMFGTVIGQNIEPKLEVVGQLVKATYFYENGAIAQEGFFKNGKLEGKWTSYEMNGNVKAVAFYAEGKKSGKWSFNDQGLNTTTVDYAENQIVAVNNIKRVRPARRAFVRGRRTRPSSSPRAARRGRRPSPRFAGARPNASSGR